MCPTPQAPSSDRPTATRLVAALCNRDGRERGTELTVAGKCRSSQAACVWRESK